MTLVAVTLSMNAGKFCIMFLSSDEFYKKITFSTKKSVILPESQTVWTQFRPDILSGLIWIQNVCKGYQQTAPADKE